MMTDKEIEKLSINILLEGLSLETSVADLVNTTNNAINIVSSREFYDFRLNLKLDQKRSPTEDELRKFFMGYQHDPSDRGFDDIRKDCQRKIREIVEESFGKEYTINEKQFHLSPEIISLLKTKSSLDENWIKTSKRGIVEIMFEM